MHSHPNNFYKSEESWWARETDGGGGRGRVKLPGRVHQQGAIDAGDLGRCQSGSQTGSQLWFVPITLLTLFNLGLAGWELRLQVSIHKENWEIHVCVRML